MKILSIRKIFVLSFIIIFCGSAAEAGSLSFPGKSEQQKSVPSKAPKHKKVRIKGPGNAKKVQKEQAAKERKQDKDYKKFVRENQQRSLEIQTPEVKERMKQNVKNANANYKAKRKHNSSRTREAGKKYR